MTQVKSRELVPVRRTVEGDVRHIRNIISTRMGRGEVVQVHSRTDLDDGRVRMLMTLMEPRQRLLVRMRRRMLERVWPAGEKVLQRSLRVAAYVAGMLLGAAVGYAIYEVVLTVVWVVRLTHRYWPALLVLAIVAVAAGGKHIAHFCQACGRAL